MVRLELSPSSRQNGPRSPSQQHHDEALLPGRQTLNQNNSEERRRDRPVLKVSNSPDHELLPQQLHLLPRSVHGSPGLTSSQSNLRTSRLRQAKLETKENEQLKSGKSSRKTKASTQTTKLASKCNTKLLDRIQDQTTPTKTSATRVNRSRQLKPKTTALEPRGVDSNRG